MVQQNFPLEMLGKLGDLWLIDFAASGRRRASDLQREQLLLVRLECLFATIGGPKVTRLLLLLDLCRCFVRALLRWSFEHVVICTFIDECAGDLGEWNLHL